MPVRCELFSSAAANGRFQQRPPPKHLQCGDNTCPPCSGGERASAVNEIERESQDCPGTTDDLRNRTRGSAEVMESMQNVMWVTGCSVEKPCPVSPQPGNTGTGKEIKTLAALELCVV